jgi:hypothetical protein
MLSNPENLNDGSNFAIIHSSKTGLVLHTLYFHIRLKTRSNTYRIK